MYQRKFILFLFSLLAQLASIDAAEYVTDNGITLIYKAFGNNVTITGYGSFDTGDLVIPNLIEGKSVTRIDEMAFYSCADLTSVTIPGSVISIDDSAFRQCEGLRTVTILEGVERISSRTFEDCYNLTSVTIPDSVTSLGERAFINCTSLTNITIPNNVTSIGEWTFYNCIDLKSIIIPSGVTSIGDGAFYSCIRLTNITIPSSVTSIGDTAFGDCGSLTSIVIPDSVTSISDGAFRGCDSLTSIVIPDSVTSIGDGAFGNCTSLTSIKIPNSITIIGNLAFNYCIDLKSITIPSGVISIGDEAFKRCIDLTSITILGGVTSIGNGAFEGCKSLTSIEIPNSVISIGNQAFENCQNLISVMFLGDAPTDFGSNVFDNTANEFIVYFFKGAEGFTTSTWNGYASAVLAELPPYTLSVSTITGGTVSIYPDKPEYEVGERVTLTATANSGFKFIGWSDDLDDSQPSKTLTMDSNKTVMAEFEMDLPNYYLSQDAFESEGGWYWSEWFGFFNMTQPDWIYHLEYDWVYANVPNNSKNSTWLYLAIAESWFWMSDSLGEGFAFDASQNSFVFWDSETRAWWPF